MNVAEALKSGTEILAASNIPEAAREASSLLQFVVGRDRTFFVAHPEYELSSDVETEFRAAVARRASHEPFQYIVGKQEFFGLDFAVTPDVLIPRPETEMLIERALEILAEMPSPTFLDIGTGSGCIAVSILANCSEARAVAVDVSQAALDVARRNASVHDVIERLELLVSDVFDNVRQQQFDLIVSNPPYVPAADLSGLQPEVRDHEPHLALSDGSTGVSIIERIIAGAPRHLTPGGSLLMEIGFSQASAVEAMFDSGVWQSVRIEPDLQGIPRMVVAELHV